MHTKIVHDSYRVIVIFKLQLTKPYSVGPRTCWLKMFCTFGSHNIRSLFPLHLCVVLHFFLSRSFSPLLATVVQKIIEILKLAIVEEYITPKPPQPTHYCMQILSHTWCMNETMFSIHGATAYHHIEHITSMCMCMYLFLAFLWFFFPPLLGSLLRLLVLFLSAVSQFFSSSVLFLSYSNIEYWIHCRYSSR